MNFFYMLVGCPASGKSTWARKRGGTHVVVSSDAIRAELFGDESVQGDPKKVFELAHTRIIEALNKGKNVIFDATNIKYKNRMNIMREVNRMNHVLSTCVIFAEPVGVLLERNEARTRHVPEEVIHRMMREFEMPTYAEGYTLIDVKCEHPFPLDELLNEAADFDQQNPHHSLTLYGHCKEAKEWIIENVCVDDWSKLQNMADAALCHDLGKIDTQVFFNHKGIESEVAHYYDHHGLGAYYCLMYDEPWSTEDRIYIAQLVCYHMQPYMNKTEDADRRWRERIGNDLWENVLVIHEADVAAH